MNVLSIRWMDMRHLLQPAHPVGFLGAQQVPLSGVHTHYFSCGRNLKALGGAAVRLQFELLGLFSHKRYLVNFFRRGLYSYNAKPALI
jgi:hypothetical protein